MTRPADSATHEAAPLPANEATRLAALAATGALDSEPDAVLDGITAALADLCDCSTGLVSLVDADRQWFKSRHGMAAKQTARDVAFCAHAVLRPQQLLEVPDALLDDRFAANPLVTGPPRIRFYAGMPLVDSNGLALGTLCVLDQRPKTLSAEQRAALERLAPVVSQVLTNRATNAADGFRALVERTAQHGVAVFDTSLQGSPLVYCTPALSDLTGYAPALLLGSAQNTLLASLMDEASAAKLHHAVATNSSSPMEVPCRRPDGSAWSAEIELAPVDAATSSQLVLVVRDVSERVQARHQTRLVQSSIAGIYAIDIDGRCTFCNETMATLLGCASAEEVIGHDMHDFSRHSYADGRLRPRDDCPILRGMAERTQVHSDDDVLWRADGTKVSVECWSYPVIEDGRVTSCVVNVVDVSEHRAGQALLSEARDLAERSAAAKSRFLAAASHDLRQPLQSLSLYLSVLQRQPDSSRNEEICAKMRSSIDTMSDLLEALLDVSRLDSGSITPQAQPLSVRELLSRVHDDNVQQAEAKGLELVWQADELTVVSDPVLLERVIENFVTNAIRYTERGTVTLGCQQHDDQLRLFVRDTGVGIPESERERIFEEYYQVDNPARDRAKGLGLGLSIVRYIANALKLPLHVESVVGAGSEFSIDVPLAAEPLQTKRVRGGAVNSAVYLGQTVLLVDDDPAIIDATSMLLAASGTETLTATDPRTGLALAAAAPAIDVVLSDYRLPDYDGIEFIRRVRAQSKTPVPAVLITGDTSAHDADVLAASDITLLRKPIEAEALLGVLRTIAERD